MRGAMRCERTRESMTSERMIEADRWLYSVLLIARLVLPYRDWLITGPKPGALRPA